MPDRGPSRYAENSAAQHVFRTFRDPEPQGVQEVWQVQFSAGRELPLTGEVMPRGKDLALRPADVGRGTWPDHLRRVATEPEDCIAIGDRAAAPLPLAVSRLTPIEDGWRIDPAIALDDQWHGACVIARRDGKLIGMILVMPEGARVALLPPATAGK